MAEAKAGDASRNNVVVKVKCTLHQSLESFQQPPKPYPPLGSSRHIVECLWDAARYVKTPCLQYIPLSSHALSVTQVSSPQLEHRDTRVVVQTYDCIISIL